MRRLVYSLTATAALLAGVLGMVVVSAPAFADGPPIAQLTAIVNPPPQPNGVLNLCVTSRSLDPNGTCINIPPSGGAPASPLLSYGQASASIQGPYFIFGFDGQITIGGHRFIGFASGSGAFVGVNNAPSPEVSPFTLSGTSPTGSLTATCTGSFHTLAENGKDVGGIAFPPSLGFGPFGGATSVLDCDGSTNGGPTGHVTLISAYRVLAYDDTREPPFYYWSGAFGGA